MREGRDLAEMQITATLIMSLHERLKRLKPGWSSLKCCRDHGVLDTHHTHLVFIYATSKVYMWLGIQARQQLHFGRSWQSRHSTSPSQNVKKVEEEEFIVCYSHMGICGRNLSPVMGVVDMNFNFNCWRNWHRKQVLAILWSS